MSILNDFLPYTWYNITLFPSYKLTTHQGGPTVDILIKYWDAEEDLFLYYKVRSVRFNAQRDETLLKQWGCPVGHKPIAFMWDGDDLPAYTNSPKGDYTGVKSFPPFLSASETARKAKEDKCPHCNHLYTSCICE